MSIQRIGNGVTIILILLCVLLSAIIYLQWQNYTQEDFYAAAILDDDTKTRDASELFLGNQGNSR